MTKVRSRIRKRVSTLIGPAAPQKRRGGGFTLIELLVVIAIISLLVSILLPSLQRAKELAKRAVCAANLHHLCMAVQTYASEYDGYPPPQYGVYANDPIDPEYGIDYHGDWGSFILGPQVYDHGLGVYSESANGWTGYLYITHWWKAMASYVADPMMLVCPSCPYAGNVDTSDNWFGYNSYHWFGWTQSNVGRGYYAGVRKGERRLTYGDDLLMSDLVALQFWGLFNINHHAESGDWLGSQSEGGIVAGSQHLYVGGNVRWVDTEGLEPSRQYGGNIIFADWPEGTPTTKYLPQFP